jgi:hypothetical protein
MMAYFERWLSNGSPKGLVYNLAATTTSMLIEEAGFLKKKGKKKVFCTSQRYSQLLR